MRGVKGLDVAQAEVGVEAPGGGVRRHGAGGYAQDEERRRVGEGNLRAGQKDFNPARKPGPEGWGGLGLGSGYALPDLFLKARRQGCVHGPLAQDLAEGRVVVGHVIPVHTCK